MADVARRQGGCAARILRREPRGAAPARRGGDARGDGQRGRGRIASTGITCNLYLGEVGGEAPFLRGVGAKVHTRFLMLRFLNARV